MSAPKRQPKTPTPDTGSKIAKSAQKFTCTSLHCNATLGRLADLNKHMKSRKHAQDVPCTITGCSFTVAPKFKEEHEALHWKTQTMARRKLWDQMCISSFGGVPADGTLLPIQAETAQPSSSNPLTNGDQQHENQSSNFVFPPSAYEHSPYQEMPQRNPASPRTTWQPNSATPRSLNEYSFDNQLQHQTSFGQNEENYTIQEGSMPFDLPTSYLDLLHNGKAWVPSEVPFREEPQLYQHVFQIPQSRIPKDRRKRGRGGEGKTRTAHNTTSCKQHVQQPERIYSISDTTTTKENAHHE